MRALFLTQWFDPEPGALRGLPLAKWMRARGHEVEVVTGFPNYPGGKVYPGYRIAMSQRETMSGVPVLRVPLYPSHDATIAGRFLNYGSFALSASTIGLALAERADVGFVYHPPPTVGLPAMAFKALRGVPFVYHIADMWPESVVESGALRPGLMKRTVESALHAWCNLVYRRAAAITVLSEGFKDLLIDRGVAAEKIHVIYNWTDEEVFTPGPRDEALATELGMAGRFNIVYAGNMGIFQGLETLIRAAVRVKHVPDIQIVMVGTGQSEDSLKALAAELGATNVRFVGRRQFWDMPKINDLADVLLVQLRDFPFFAATIPSKTQVSLASGRPVLMSVRGNAASIIQQAGAGVTVNPDDDEALAAGMLALYGTPRDELDAMGTRGRRFYLDRMSLDVGGRQTEAVLEEVLEQRR
ncbi:MAG: glycosyltransferase family 4 protein, partial [Gemmatimonadaceae bacterium]